MKLKFAFSALLKYSQYSCDTLRIHFSTYVSEFLSRSFWKGNRSVVRQDKIGSEILETVSRTRDRG